MIAHLDLATTADAGAAIALLTRQLREHAIDLAEGAIDRAVRAILLDDAKGSILLARHGGVAVGVACLARTFTLEHGGWVCWLDELYVVPELRGRGIGGALLARAVEHARAIGAAALELEVETSHARAARLYERAGFRPLARARWSLAIHDHPW
jgi:GNAT superfamily N-acetyltransferase